MVVGSSAACIAQEAMVAFVNRNTRNGGAQLAPGIAVRAGQVIAGKYRVEELLGCSAAAVVVAAHHVHLRHEVTLKLLSPCTDEQAAAAERHVARARIAARLRGPHVARTLDVGTTADGTPFLATERFAGRTVAAELEERGRVPYSEAVLWALEACEALAEAHALGLIHGDLKTQNLFLARRDGGAQRDRVARPTVKVLDFGSVNALEATGDGSATAWFSSPAYVAPEQVSDPARVDARADIWALGVIVHEAIAGARPFTADTVSGVLVSVCFDAPPLLSDAPYELARLVQWCLAKDPEKRPATVDELASELARFVGPEGRRSVRRVRAALSSPPPDDEEPAPEDTGSIAPVARPIAPERGSPTKPSRRVVAKRKRGRALRATTGLFATALAALGIASMASTDESSADESSADDSVEPAVSSDEPPTVGPREPLEVRASAPRFDAPAPAETAAEPAIDPAKPKRPHHRRAPRRHPSRRVHAKPRPTAPSAHDLFSKRK